MIRHFHFGIIIKTSRGNGHKKSTVEGNMKISFNSEIIAVLTVFLLGLGHIETLL